MRIIFFCRLFSPHIGGVEKHVFEIATRLQRKGHAVSIITERYSDKLPSHEKIQGLQVYRIDPGENEFLKKFRIWVELFTHIKLLKKADVVHCHDIFFWYLPFRFLFVKKPVYTTFHGYEGDIVPGLKSKFMHKVAEVLSFGNICVGDYLQKWYGTKANAITYGAVHVPRAKTSKKAKKNHAVFIGRLEHEAGIMTYLRALRACKNSISLTVLGDGTLRKQAEAYVEKYNLNVEFRGFVNDVYAHAKYADFIFTSRFLGTLEAFAIKKFVFATYNKQILRDCFAMSPFSAYLSLSSSPAMLAKALIHFKNKRKEKDKKIELGYSWVKKQTWEKLVKQYLLLWGNK